MDEIQFEIHFEIAMREREIETERDRIRGRWESAKLKRQSLVN